MVLEAVDQWLHLCLDRFKCRIVFFENADLIVHLFDHELFPGYILGQSGLLFGQSAHLGLKTFENLLGHLFHRHLTSDDLLFALHIHTVLADRWENITGHPVLEGFGFRFV